LLENRKILVFSQFTSMLKIIEEELQKREIEYVKLTGATKNREKVINKFKNEDIQIFLISLKAGGVGLNLTEADTIIHYDPWWNPAVENQATDRAYRIGQDKPVFVYKLIVENTIEQKIIELQNKKSNMQKIIYDEGDTTFDKNELLELLK
jgi:SNF2 family DNA or RNA helicase